MFSFSKKILSKLLSLLNNSLSALKISGRNIYNHSAFTLTELIVVITILSILSVIGFVVMSHQSSVARDGKRISDIQTLSQSAKITSAQLRLLPTPIADSVSLTVSGTFIGYQGFMSLALVNPLGYGSDKIFDPKDNIPYTYRVNQHYDSAQFMAYLENPRFERSIEIAKNQFLRNEEIGMNGGGFDGGLSGREDDDRNRGNQEVGMNGFGGLFDGVVSRAYALDTSDSDLTKRYPYAAGDKLGIFLRKDSNAPIQSGVNGTGSQSISTLDNSTLRVLVSEDTYLGSISTGALLSLKDGSFDEKALLSMNSGSGGSGSGGGDSGGGGGPVSHILTMGEYSIMGETYYGYIGPLTISLYATYGVIITTITPGSLIDDTVDGYVIDSVFANSTFSAWQTILAGSTDMPSNVAFETPYANLNCTNSSVIDSLTMYGCTGSTVSTDFYLGSQHDLGIVFPPPEVACTNPGNATDSNYFTFNSSTQTITGYDGVNGPKDIVIPCNIGGKNVKYIGNLAFRSKQLTSVTIPNSVTSIGIHAFSNNQITSVTIPNSVTSLGASAFNGNQLTSVTIPNSITNIGDTTFSYNQLTSVIIPGSITSIGNNAFANNQLTGITIPGSVTSIGSSAFSSNQLTSVTIQDGVTSIGSSAFNSNQLTSVVIPGSVTNIGSNAFTFNQLTSVTISDGVTSIGSSAFTYNQITSVIIGNSVTSIGDSAFNSNQLTSVVIPNSVTSIGNAAFRSNLLTSVIIPGSVTSIGGYAFTSNQLTSVTIQDGVTNIGDMAFNSNQLTSVVIPNSVTIVDSNAFSNNQLTSVTIPNSVTSIGNGAFGANQLTSVTIPNSVTNIGAGAFMNNQLTSITIPSSITSISNSSFSYNQLTSITIPGSVMTIGSDSFFGNQLTSVTILDGATSIGNNAFRENQLTSVTIPGSVTNIGATAFTNQTNSLGNGIVYGPSSGYVKDTYTNNSFSYFDKVKLPNYVDTP